MNEDRLMLLLESEVAHIFSQAWDPAETPRLASPSSTASSSISGVRSRKRPRRSGTRRRLTMPEDSGSEVEQGADEDEDETEFDDYAGMRTAVRALRELQLIQDEEAQFEEAQADEAQAEELAEAGPSSREQLNPIYNWTDNYDTFLGRREDYQRTPGLSDEVHSQSPVQIFILIWDLSIVEHIVQETNKYAWQTIMALSEEGRISANLDTWVETTVPEIYRYLAVLMYMSLNPRGHIPEYWSTGVLGMPDFRRLMSRNRFQMLSRFLHFVDNDNIPDEIRSYNRKIVKVAPLLEHLNRKFYDLYTPNQHLSIDESLLLWKGRLSWVQCIRTKAARFGIKSFEVCEATTGYMLRCLIYAGKSASMHEEPIHGFSAPTEKVVLKLMEGFLDVGHCLVMDNWYNQLPLTRYLKLRATDLIGTLNRRRQHVPAVIKNANDQMLRGHHVSCHCGDLSLTVWKDVKLVTTISTYHDDQMVPGRRAGEDVQKPVSVSEYNKYMGGVDLKDQKLSMYLLERKRGLKWYIKVFRRLVNISILNSYIIYLKHPLISPLTHRQFRYKLAEELCVQFPRTEPARPVAQGSSILTRLDNAPDHYPAQTEPISGKPSQHVRRRCMRCSAQQKRTQVTTMCRKCEAPLCLGKCWIEFHTLQKL